MQFWECSLETALKCIPIRDGPHRFGYSGQMFLEFRVPKIRGKPLIMPVTSPTVGKSRIDSF